MHQLKTESGEVLNAKSTRGRKAIFSMQELYAFY